SSGSGDLVEAPGVDQNHVGVTCRIPKGVRVVSSLDRNENPALVAFCSVNALFDCKGVVPHDGVVSKAPYTLKPNRPAGRFLEVVGFRLGTHLLTGDRNIVPILSRSKSILVPVNSDCE